MLITLLVLPGGAVEIRALLLVLLHRHKETELPWQGGTAEGNVGTGTVPAMRDRAAHSLGAREEHPPAVLGSAPSSSQPPFTHSALSGQPGFHSQAPQTGLRSQANLPTAFLGDSSLSTKPCRYLQYRDIWQILLVPVMS